jgi:hypothetical protein
VKEWERGIIAGKTYDYNEEIPIANRPLSLPLHVSQKTHLLKV